MNNEYISLLQPRIFKANKYIYLKEDLITGTMYDEIFYFNYMKHPASEPLECIIDKNDPFNDFMVYVKHPVNNMSFYVSMQMIDIEKTLPEHCKAIRENLSPEQEYTELLSENL